jgi:hypothetical protein
VAWLERTWAVEGAGGLGHLLAQRLVAPGEQVLDVQPKLGARVRLLASADTNKNDPNDARSMTVTALRSAACRSGPMITPRRGRCGLSGTGTWGGSAPGCAKSALGIRVKLREHLSR